MSKVRFPPAWFTAPNRLQRKFLFVSRDCHMNHTKNDPLLKLASLKISIFSSWCRGMCCSWHRFSCHRCCHPILLDGQLSFLSSRHDVVCWTTPEWEKECDWRWKGQIGFESCRNQHSRWRCQSCRFPKSPSKHPGNFIDWKSTVKDRILPLPVILWGQNSKIFKGMDMEARKKQKQQATKSSTLPSMFNDGYRPPQF